MIEIKRSCNSSVKYLSDGTLQFNSWQIRLTASDQDNLMKMVLLDDKKHFFPEGTKDIDAKILAWALSIGLSKLIWLHEDYPNDMVPVVKE